MSGSNLVEKVAYSEPDQRVCINKSQYLRASHLRYGISISAATRSARSGSKTAKMEC